MPECEDAHDVMLRQEVVKRDETCLPAGNDELPHAGLCFAADQRVSLQHLRGFLDEGDNFTRQLRVVVRVVVEDPLEGAERPG
jgi:hypothetical protein